MAMTLDREILGFLPWRSLCFANPSGPASLLCAPACTELPADESWDVPLIALGFFGVGIPEGGISKGLLNIFSGRGDSTAVFESSVILFNVSAPDVRALFKLELTGRAAFASELAVGARSRDDDSLDDCLEDDDEEPTAMAVEDMRPVERFLPPRLVAVPREEGLLAADEYEVRVPIEDAPPWLPMALFADVTVPVIELVRLGLKLLLDVGGGTKEGSGDLARTDDVVDALPFGWSFPLPARQDDTLVEPLATELVTAGETFVESSAGGMILFSDLDASLGIPLDDGADAADTVLGLFLPLFQTFWTRDFAVDRNPNLEGLGCGSGLTEMNS